MNQEIFELHAQLEQQHWWFAARRRILGVLVSRLLPESREALVIDVGCGTGANIASLADRYSCIGIDPSEHAIALARKRFPSVRFLTGSAPADLGEASRMADLLLLMDVLEHVPDDFALFSEIAAAARPGAYILISVPANQSLWSEHDVTMGHFRRYSRNRLELLWEGLPLEVRLLTYFNNRLYPVVKSVRSVGRLRGKAGGDAHTDLSLPPGPLNAVLERIFAGEARVILDLLEGRRQRGYRRGVSLLALLRREARDFVPRTRPAHAPPDLCEPVPEVRASAPAG